MTPFHRYRPAMAAFFAACLQMAAWVGIVAAMGQDPMPASIYGHTAMHAPVMAWVAAQFILSAAALAGCIANAPGIAAIAGALLGVLFVILTAAGFSAIPGGTPIAAMSFGAAGLCFVSAWVAWGHHG